MLVASSVVQFHGTCIQCDPFSCHYTIVANKCFCFSDVVTQNWTALDVSSMGLFQRYEEHASEPEEYVPLSSPETCSL